MGKQNLGFLRGNWMKKPCLILFEQRKGRGKKKSTRLFATSRLVGFFEDRKGNVCVPTRPPNMIFFCTHAARESRHTHSHTLHYTTLRIHSPSIKPCDPGREPVRPSRDQWNCRAAPSSFSLLVFLPALPFQHSSVLVLRLAADDDVFFPRGKEKRTESASRAIRNKGPSLFLSHPITEFQSLGRAASLLVVDA